MDLSPKGHQPMHSANKRVSVIFNGEIYNHQELREEIGNYNFSSDCDTEVIIAAYLKWGIDFVHRINGMFAIALLDRDTDTVYLIRDRIGKKPLYYYKDSGGNIVFGSELKAILYSKLFKGEINKDVIGRFLYRNYIISPDTIYQNTFKLEPGAIMEISRDLFKNYKYWDMASKYNDLKNDRFISYDEAKEELRDLLRNAIAKRMVADVPVGAFLSGGYDSSLVCAIAQELSREKIKTFAIGFYEKKFNEAIYAKQIAQTLGTDHQELYIDEKDMLDVLESIPYYYDEPFADSSQIPTMLVSKLAKEKVSVVLSGDGGDELFGGYNIYTILQQAQKKKIWGRILYEMGKVPGMKRTSFWKRRSIVYRILSDHNNPEARTQGGVNSYFDTINRIMLQDVNNFYYEFESKYQEDSWAFTRMLLDMESYLPDDILAKVDRASMKYALECRCPILDKEIIEYSYRLPLDFKIHQGNKKRILKDLAYEYIPQEMLDRPKAGFSIPLDKWLRGILKEQIMDWTNRDYLIRQGIFEPGNTINFINNYMENGDAGNWSGQNFSKVVWAYFVFQQWYYRYGNKMNQGEDENMKYSELEDLRLSSRGGYNCIFGAGLIGCTWAYELLEAIGFRISFYCDNSKRPGTTVKDNIKIISLENLYALKDEVLVFIAVGDRSQSGIRDQLLTNGIKNIISMDYRFLETFIKSIQEKDDQEINNQFRFVLDDAEYLCRQFEYYMGYRPDLENPRTFNEKLQWLKLYDRNPNYIKLVDKYTVKEYIKEKLGEEYVIPTLGIFNSLEEINIDKLPQQFVLKCTHDSGSAVVCEDKDKFDWDKTKKVLECCLERNFYWVSREWIYKDIEKRIIVEEYLLEISKMIDYKFLCFNGKVGIIFTCSDRFEQGGLKVTFFDTKWNRLPFERHYPTSENEIEKPENLSQMIELSEKLSEGIPFVRVDFYNIKGKIYFGEMTFFPGAGMEEFSPVEWDYELGKMIELNRRITGKTRYE